MKQLHHLDLLILVVFLVLLSSNIVHSTTSTITIQDSYYHHRRVLHQPLYPVSSAPPPVVESPPPPPPPDVFPNPDQPFFPEDPTGQNSDQNTSPPPPSSAEGVSANGSIPIPAATQPTKPTKKVAIAISVGIVTLGMLSALAFFLYRHRARHPGETQKLVSRSSQRLNEESRVVPPPPSTSSFLYIGTVEPPSNRRSVIESNGGGGGGGENGVNVSPYHKLNSVKRSDRYRPSPDLQPLPPLTNSREHPIRRNSMSSAGMSSSDEESLSQEAFYTPQCSSVSNEEGNFTPVSRQNHPSNNNNSSSAISTVVPHSKRTSPKSRLSASSPDMKHTTIIPAIAQPPPPPPPPPPPFQQPQIQQNKQKAAVYTPQRPKFSPPPPPPNMALLQSIAKSSPRTSNIPGPPTPPPPPLPPPLMTPRKLGHLETSSNSSTPSPQALSRQQFQSPSSKDSSRTQTPKPVKEEVTRNGNSLERLDSDEMEGGKPKLKALHWDKVRATSDRATVWDQLKSSSFKLNEDMMETLFGCNSTNSVPKEATRKSVLPPVENENRVLDPKKSQNIAILLRALNVTRDEVSEALLDGNPEGLGAELLETLVKMAPTKEEEIKLRDYSGDITKLGSAERFLKAVLDIPFAFKRVEAMLYRANFDTEVKYLRKSFQTLEAASEELKNSRLFFKLLEAVLRTGNRMNVGTNRGDAKAFKLDTLLKLVDIKGTDGKTTLLHFVVQEIIRTQGAGSETKNENLQNKMREDEFKKQGLPVVAGLSRDLANVKKAAGMDSDVLSGYVLKLAMGLEKVGLVLQYEKPDMQGKFFDSMKLFLREAEKEILQIKADERKALSLVKEATEYFHGDAAKEEAHPFRIFMIVRDFLSVLDNVCKEVGRMQDRTVVGAARSFRISSTASLPVLNRLNVRQDRSSDDESLSP